MLKGTAHKYDANVDTDAIIPARYLNLSEPEDLAKHCMEDIKASGISCVIAKSFARIFFRNAINIGLPLLESEDAPDNIEMGDKVEVDLTTGTIKNLTNGKTFTAKPYPDFMAGLISAGGLIEYTKERLGVK